MSKIDLSNYDFKDVLEWVCEQFPSNEEIQLLVEEGSERIIKLNGYRMKNIFAFTAIRGWTAHKGLRDLIRSMKKIEEPKEQNYTANVNLRLKREPEITMDLSVKELAELLKPFLRDE